MEEKQGQENEKEMTYSLFLGFDSRKIINECDGRIGADALELIIASEFGMNQELCNSFDLKLGPICALKLSNHLLLLDIFHLSSY